MTPQEVLSMIKENGAKMVDLRFMDFPGLWQHFSVPVSEVDESVFEDGFGFDGSSIRGWQPINASDMLVIPDPTTAKMDPFYAEPTLTLICNIVDPVTRESYTRDPRYIARKAEAYLKQSIYSPDEYVVDGYPAGQMLAVYRDRLSEQELEALITYLLSLSEEGP